MSIGENYAFKSSGSYARLYFMTDYRRDDICRALKKGTLFGDW